MSDIGMLCEVRSKRLTRPGPGPSAAALQRGRGFACLLGSGQPNFVAVHGHRSLTLVEPVRSLVASLRGPVRSGN
jgi:hypothetical protein